MAADNSASIGGVSVLEADELALIGRVPFPNALLIGSYESVGALLAALTPRLQGPILRCDHFLEETIHQLERGTLVLWSVDRLESAGQGTLLRFVDDRRDVQVISVATTSLFERVQRGVFLESLYYRLNDVLIEVTALSQ